LLILAVETSCDDSAVALLSGTETVAEVIRSQTEHEGTGGVIPEIASRLHMEVLPGLVSAVLDRAGRKLTDVDVFAATAGPGLIGSLLVGLSWAKAAAFSTGKPFLGINHLAAHLFAHYTTGGRVEFPAVALLASGGHTSLFLLREGWHDCMLLGGTRDDAAGESFDKTAKLLGLGYPGGPAIDRLYEAGDPRAISLPLPLEDPGSPEFSFSGLKTAVRLQWEKGARIEDVAASFNYTVVRILSTKLFAQVDRHGARTALAGGGVAANRLLRETLARECAKRGIALLLPECPTDNATMVGRAAAAVLERNPEARSGLSCNAFARWTGERLEALVP
jgi:N6-L-threonylcarbamoyladenine synthase